MPLQSASVKVTTRSCGLTSANLLQPLVACAAGLVIDVLDIYAVAVCICEGDYAQLRVNFRDLLQPLVACAAGLPRV